MPRSFLVVLVVIYHHFTKRRLMIPNSISMSLHINSEKSVVLYQTMGYNEFATQFNICRAIARMCFYYSVKTHPLFWHPCDCPNELRRSK